MGGREEGLGGIVRGVDTVPISGLVLAGIGGLATGTAKRGLATGTAKSTGLGMSEAGLATGTANILTAKIQGGTFESLNILSFGCFHNPTSR